MHKLILAHKKKLMQFFLFYFVNVNGEFYPSKA